MKVLYFTALENTERNSIHENQILSLKSLNIDYRFLFVSPLFILNRSLFKINRHKFVKDRTCVEYKIPIFSFNFYLYVALIPYVLLWVSPILIFNIFRFKPQIIHCRNLISIFIAVISKKIFHLNCAIVADPRSVYPEEGVIIKRWKYTSFDYNIWKKIERWSFQRVNACIGLSCYFTKYLLNFNVKSFCIPAVVGSSKKYNSSLRKKIRNNYNIKDNELILIYVGSVGLWHDINLLTQIIDKIILGGIECRIIALSASKELKNRFENRYEEKCLFCGSVSTKCVEEFLFMADWGIIPGSLKEGYEYDLLYKTMLASKAEEYLCAGLPIIANDRIINLKECITQYAWGTIYNFKENFIDCSKIRIYTSYEREKISNEAMNFFGVDVVKKQLFDLYSDCIKNGSTMR